MLDFKLPPAINAFNAIEMIVDFFDSQSLFYGHGTDNAWDEAVALVLQRLQMPFYTTEAELQQPLSSAIIEQLQHDIHVRVVEKKPLPYITNRAYFCDLEFYVDERVLIPRSPIAELIKQHFYPWVKPGQVQRVLDMCTGSACIAIAIAKHLNNVAVDAVDIDPGALTVARQNIAEHDCQNIVQAIESDLFNSVPHEKYDIIVSNPPYVNQHDFNTMPDEFNQEPELALRAGDDGLSIVLRLLQIAPSYLNDNGILIVEVGNSAKALEEKFQGVPFLWLEFEHGGEGVFLLTKEQLLNAQAFV